MEKEKPKILIIDDDASIRDLLESILGDHYTVLKNQSAKLGLETLRTESIDVVLLDIMLGDDNGLDVLKDIKKYDEKIEVIMITVVREVRVAVKAMQMGAFDYINKNFESDELKLIINKALQKRNLFHEVQCLRSEAAEKTHLEYVPGHNIKMKEINDIISRIAQTPSNVLIQGESGTGKEIVARRIHELRSATTTKFRPFISVNVASIPAELLETTLFGQEKGIYVGAHKAYRGKFELADGGTLFLDEISDLKLEIQAKLLRAIQDKEIERVGGVRPIKVSLRVIAATNRNLAELVKKEKFREDLYYRLNVIPVSLPPLKERPEDIQDFVNLFFKRYCHLLNRNLIGLSPGAMACLQAHTWPGNIRELENTIERMIALSTSSLLTKEDLPIELRVFFGKVNQGRSTQFDDVLKDASNTFERGLILKALEQEKWNQVKTAEFLGIHRKTLEYKIKKLMIQDVVEEKRKLSRLVDDKRNFGP